MDTIKSINSIEQAAQVRSGCANHDGMGDTTGPCYPSNDDDYNNHG